MHNPSRRTGSQFRSPYKSSNIDRRIEETSQSLRSAEQMDRAAVTEELARLYAEKRRSRCMRADADGLPFYRGVPGGWER